MPAITISTASDSSLDEQLQTIAAFVGLGALLLTAIALVNQRHLRIRDSDPGRDAASPCKMGIFRAEQPSYFQVIRGKRTVLPSVPTIGDLIRAGDLGFWTSATLNCIHASPGRPGWVPLMESIVCSIALAEKSSGGKGSDLVLPPKVRLLVERADGLLNPTHPLRSRLQFYDGPSPKLIGCIRKFDISEPNPRGYLRNPPAGTSPTEVTPERTPQTSRAPSASAPIPLTTLSPSASPSSPLTIGTTPLWLSQSSFCVPVSSVETLTLAATLGIPLSINDFTQHVHGTGPVNSSLSINCSQSASANANTVTLSIGRTHSFSTFSSLSGCGNGAGSGYTTTMAKHVAFGCIPFAENQDWVRAVYVTDSILLAIKEGRSIKDVSQGYGGASIEYLWELPAAKEVDAMYHCVSGWGLDGREGDIGVLRTASGEEMWLRRRGGKEMVRATWQRAVLGIVFGGLVPQGSRPLVEGVQFTHGGENLGGCLNELENLMNDLHQLDSGSLDENLTMELYGEMVHDRCRLRDSVTGLDVSRPMRCGTAKAAAIFHRYMTLLELVVARCDLGDGRRGQNGRFQDDYEFRGQFVLDRVFEESVGLMDRVYLAAVKTHLAQNPVEGAPAWTLSSTETSLLNEDLGEALAGIRVKVSQNKGGFGLSDCATVVRCILAAWACQVPMVPWNDEEITNLELGPLSTSTFVPRTRRLAVLADLPQVAGLR